MPENTRGGTGGRAGVEAGAEAVSDMAGLDGGRRAGRHEAVVAGRLIATRPSRHKPCPRPGMGLFEPTEWCAPLSSPLPSGRGSG